MNDSLKIDKLKELTEKYPIGTAVNTKKAINKYKRTICTQEELEKLKEQYEKVYPNKPLEYSFLDGKTSMTYICEESFITGNRIDGYLFDGCQWYLYEDMWDGNCQIIDIKEEEDV